MPPTSIDGTDITGATIDGTDVQEITVDGDTVFTAGPPIPTNQLQYWFSASQETSADGTTINTLPDFSGNNRDGSHTDGNKAVYNTSGGDMNNAAYYDFDGEYTLSFTPSNTSGFSLFAVYNNSSDPPNNADASQFDFGSGGDHWPYSFGEGFSIRTGKGSRWIDSVPGLDSSGTHLLYIYGDGNDLVAEQYDGGTTNTIGTDSTSSYTFNQNVQIGGRGNGKNLKGEVYEIFYYDRYLSAAEETTIANFLNPLYGLNF